MTCTAQLTLIASRNGQKLFHVDTEEEMSIYRQRERWKASILQLHHLFLRMTSHYNASIEIQHPFGSDCFSLLLIQWVTGHVKPERSLEMVRETTDKYAFFSFKLRTPIWLNLLNTKQCVSILLNNRDVR